MTDQKQEKNESKNFINLGVVLNKKNEVLMIRRVKEEIGKEGSILKWAFPGGKQRFKESRSECVKREVLDETGYDIKPEREISLRIHPQFFITIVYHLCSLNSENPIAEPIEAHEVAEIKWVKTEEMPSLVSTDLDPNVKKILNLK